jgi:hypothetical protein
MENNPLIQTLNKPSSSLENKKRHEFESNDKLSIFKKLCYGVTLSFLNSLIYL